MSHKTIPFNKAPTNWKGRTSLGGHEIYIKDNQAYYKSDNSKVEGYRKCIKCNQFPDENGHDKCLGQLGKVINACCGHGGKGYIQFENGLIISGEFEIDKTSIKGE